MDLAGHRRPHPTPPRPPAGRRPPPPLGEAGRARSTHPPPGQPRVQEPPPELALPGPCTETHRPAPGRPPGSKNRHTATRYDVGKTAKRPETITERDQVRP